MVHKKHVKLENLKLKEIREGIFRGMFFRDESRNLQMDFFRLVPGVQSPHHKHLGDEWVYVLKGNMRDSEGEYSQGDFVLIEKDSEHVITAGKEGCEIIVVYSKEPY